MLKIVNVSWLVILFSFSTVFALDSSLKKKYPYLALTDDHGILKENDLRNYTQYLHYEKFSGKVNGLIYWQCFPRENITMILKDKGYSSEEVGWKDTMADLDIVVWVRQGVYHHYSMNRSFTVNDYQKDFTALHRLMRNEKYVCISGSYVNHEMTPEGEETYFWIFDKIKTKNGSAPK